MPVVLLEQESRCPTKSQGRDAAGAAAPSAASSATPIDFLTQPTRHLFFTGKGGVGKTSLSTAAALTLADAGQKVLLVSTDAASNLDEMLGVALHNSPTPVPGASGLWVLNIDPDTAAEAYRQRVLVQMGDAATEAERATVREQLSGACTTEIASFDEFASLLSDGPGRFDHIVFDTAPTGHTLRLLSLPKAWSGFLAGNDRGASCLGPHSGLKMQEQRFQAALAALSDPALTTVVLVTRADTGAITEAARTSAELHALGLHNQRLAVNGVFHASDRSDAVACAIEDLGQRALQAMPPSLKQLPQDQVPLRAFDTVGLPALRALLSPSLPIGAAMPAAPAQPATHRVTQLAGLAALADELATADHGLIMVMGKGGVGKTTVAAALALGLVGRGKTVHLSTTDPAAHLAVTLGVWAAESQARVDPALEPRLGAARGPGCTPGQAVQRRMGSKAGSTRRAGAICRAWRRCTRVAWVHHAPRVRLARHGNSPRRGPGFLPPTLLTGDVPGLQVSRIDPAVETQRYVDKIMAAKSPHLDPQERALLLEDLRSPCTEEVAVFHAFSRIVSEGRSAFVVLDTAPTGHSMLLMDATGAYHRQMKREFEGHGIGRVVTPLMRLQDAAYTKIILVTLAEVTPVSQAAALQDDLRRASVEPYAWVLNKSVLGAGTHDPLLAARLAGERRQIERMSGGLAKRLFTLPWLTVPPVGVLELSKLVARTGDQAPAQD